MKCPSKAELVEILTKDLVRRKSEIYRGHEDDARYFVRRHLGPSRRDMMLAASNYGLVPRACWSWPKPR